MIVGGTGLFPFLDLLDILFKIMVHDKNRIDDPTIARYRQLMKSYTFKLIVAVDREE
jgi:hypothetical protein